jgi:hypothetical protein
MRSLPIITKTFLLIIVGLFCSCTAEKVAFTPDIQHTYHFTEEKLKSVQFYTSDNIFLTVSKNNDVSRVSNGKIIINEADIQDQIFFPKNTPCVLEKILDSDKFIVSFETGNGRQLCFVNNGNTYSIGAKEWSDTQGLVKYAGKNYFTMNKETFLMIKVRKLNHIIRTSRTVKGRKI